MSLQIDSMKMDDSIADSRDVSIAMVTVPDGCFGDDDVGKPFNARPPEPDVKYVESVTLSCADLITHATVEDCGFQESVNAESVYRVEPVLLIDTSVHCGDDQDNDHVYYDVRDDVNHVDSDEVRNCADDVTSRTDQQVVVMDIGNDVCLVSSDEPLFGSDDLAIAADCSSGVDSSDDSFRVDLRDETRSREDCNHENFDEQSFTTHHDERAKTAALLPKQLSVLDVVYESENSENDDDDIVETETLATSDRRRHVDNVDDALGCLSTSSNTSMFDSDSTTSLTVSKSVGRHQSVINDDGFDNGLRSDGKPPVGRNIPLSLSAERSPDYVIVQGQKVELRQQKPPSVSTKRVNSFRKSLIKLGSFGREHSAAKEKHKKDKDKDKDKDKQKEKEKDKNCKDKVSFEPHLRNSFSWDSSIGQMFPAMSKTPDQRASGLTSPAAGSSKRISEPKLADADVQQKMAVEKVSKLRQMLEQVQQEHETLKAEYNRQPTQDNFDRLDNITKVMQRLKAQLMNPRSPSICETNFELSGDCPVPQEAWTDSSEVRRRSLDIEVLSQKANSSDGLPPHPPHPSSQSTGSSGIPPVGPARKGSAHRLGESAYSTVAARAIGVYGDENNSGKKEVSLSRSYSDSYRRNPRLPTDDVLRQTASNDELQNLRQPKVTEPVSSSLASSASSESVKQRFPCDRSRSKSQELGSVSDDNTGETTATCGSMESPLSPVNETSINDSIFSDASFADPSSMIGSGLIRQANIMGMEEDEFSEEENECEQGVFSDFAQIRSRPAHLAVFLHYLLSNSNPNPLLFYLITEIYQNSTKDLKEMRKWAYEIYSSFLVDKAYLKVSMPDEVLIAIENILMNKHEKEECMKSLFMLARNFAYSAIGELLSDYRSKRSLGLGTIYGDHELKENMDHAAVMKTFDSTVWGHFERHVLDEDKDSSQLMASALATFLRSHNYANSNAKSNALLQNCPIFNAKDKKTAFFTKSIKPKPANVKNHHNHNFLYQHYVQPTRCHVCSEFLCGIGYQGFQCSKCEYNVHKRCAESPKEFCSGRKDLRKRPYSDIFRPPVKTIPPVKEPAAPLRPPVEEVGLIVAGSAHYHEDKGDDESAEVVGSMINNSSGFVRTVSMPSVRGLDKKSLMSHSFFGSVPGPDNSNSHGRSVKDSAQEVVQNHEDMAAPLSDASVEPSDGFISPKHGHFARLSDGGVGDLTSVGDPGLAFIPSRRQYDDSDLETEPEMPPTDTIIAKEFLKKLKPKERKRQDVINELFYTERAHVRNLKVMQQLFYQPMLEDESIASKPFVNMLFSNIDEMVLVHGELNCAFKQRRKESAQGIVEKVGDLLVNRFTREEGKSFMEKCALFCENQSQALEHLRAKQLRANKDQKLARFAQFLQARIQDPLCRRLQLKDLLPTAMQRLTKYPMLIDKLISYTPPDTDEYSQLQEALVASKTILSFVNSAVTECENSHKLLELHRRLDKKSMENSSDVAVSEFKGFTLDPNQPSHPRLLLDGQLTWRLSKAREIDIHAVLLENVIVLLQRQDDKLLLRSQGKDSNATHSPIIQLSTMLTRSVANDKRALYMISHPPGGRGPQIYELVASSKDERNKWLKYITEAAEVYKDNNPLKTPPRMQKRYRAQPILSESMRSSEIRSIDSDYLSPVDKGGNEQEELLAMSDHRSNEEIDAKMTEVEHTTLSSPVSMSGAETVQGCFENLQRTNELIHQLMNEKRRMLANLMHISDDDYDTVAEMNVELPIEKDASELVFASLTLADRLTQIANERLQIDEHHSGDEQHQDIQASSSSPELSTLATGVFKDTKFPVRQLLNISDRLHQNLTNLLKLIVSRPDDVVFLPTSSNDATEAGGFTSGPSNEEHQSPMHENANEDARHSTDTSNFDSVVVTKVNCTDCKVTVNSKLPSFVDCETLSVLGAEHCEQSAEPINSNSTASLVVSDSNRVSSDTGSSDSTKSPEQNVAS